jgi:general secretion pathway protein I
LETHAFAEPNIPIFQHSNIPGLIIPLFHLSIRGVMTMQNKKQGFTLIEVIVALAILGIGLTVIIELFSGGLRLAKVSEEYSKGVNYARSKMEEVMIQPVLEEGTEEGEFDDTYRWAVGIEKVELLPVPADIDLKPPVELFLIKINVQWKSGSKTRSTSVESYKTLKIEEDETKS